MAATEHGIITLFSHHRAHEQEHEHTSACPADCPWNGNPPSGDRLNTVLIAVCTFLAGLVVSGAVFMNRDVATMDKVDKAIESRMAVVGEKLDMFSDQHKILMSNEDDMKKEQERQARITYRNCVALGGSRKDCSGEQ